LLAFWTLKNPSYPERIIKYPSRITSCKFSEANPNLIAAGTHEGVVAIWDIRKGGNKPI
jgi:WD40 repeat protein